MAYIETEKDIIVQSMLETRLRKYKANQIEEKGSHYGMYLKWEDELILSKVCNGESKTIRQIAEILNRSVGAVQVRRSLLLSKQ